MNEPSEYYGQGWSSAEIIQLRRGFGGLWGCAVLAVVELFPVSRRIRSFESTCIGTNITRTERSEPSRMREFRIMSSSLPVEVVNRECRPICRSSCRPALPDGSRRRKTAPAPESGSTRKSSANPLTSLYSERRPTTRADVRMELRPVQCGPEDGHPPVRLGGAR